MPARSSSAPAAAAAASTCRASAGRAPHARCASSSSPGRSERNRLGIEEPQDTPSIGARWLDIVFLPLVGFDRFGLRLGTGGGFYDRAFAFRQARHAWHAPRLIGIAYAFQEVERISPHPHDVPLDAVITEKGIIRCATG